MKVLCIDTAINIRRLSRQILKNEPKILKKYPDVKIHSITDIRETFDETITNKDNKQSIKEK